MMNKVKSRLAGKKLSSKEIKDVLGGSSAGGRTVCVTCSDTVGGDPHNVMCTKQDPGQVCIDVYGSVNGILCANLNTGESNFYKCPSGTQGQPGNTQLTAP